MLLNGRPLFLQDTRHGIRHILDEVPAIRHLDRFRGALSSAFGIRTSSISDEDLGGAVVEQVNGPMRLQIFQPQPG